MKTEEKKIYLTFDDGPVPGVTPAALSVLKEAGVKATFFCVGDNVRKHPDVFAQVVAEGHAVGNHTFHHVDGWQTPSLKYLREVQECSAFVKSELFRPPYGRMRRSQFNALKKKFKVVMWDVLTCDFDPSLTKEDVLALSLKHAREGSIVVFHDSVKAEEKMLWALPRFIERMQQQGFTFGVL